MKKVLIYRGETDIIFDASTKEKEIIAFKKLFKLLDEDLGCYSKLQGFDPKKVDLGCYHFCRYHQIVEENF